jgi:hypothetical protein
MKQKEESMLAGRERKRLNRNHMKKHPYSKSLLKQMKDHGAFVLAPEGEGSSALVVFPKGMSPAASANIARELDAFFTKRWQSDVKFKEQRDGSAIAKLDTGYRPGEPSDEEP